MKYALFKGLEGTLWKDMELVEQGELESVLNEFPERDGAYILWWLIDIKNLPEGYELKDISKLFIRDFAKDYFGKDYKAAYVAGFHDDIARNRSWGLLKNNLDSEQGDA